MQSVGSQFIIEINREPNMQNIFFEVRADIEKISGGKKDFDYPAGYHKVKMITRDIHLAREAQKKIIAAAALEAKRASKAAEKLRPKVQVSLLFLWTILPRTHKMCPPLFL